MRGHQVCHGCKGIQDPCGWRPRGLQDPEGHRVETSSWGAASRVPSLGDRCSSALRGGGGASVGTQWGRPQGSSLARGPGGGLRGTGCGQRRAERFGAASGHSNHRRDTRPETRPLAGVKRGFFCSDELIKGKWRLLGFAVLFIFAFKHAAGAIYQLDSHEE